MSTGVCKHLRDLAPRIRTTHATDTPEKCQRIREGARQDIGCSGCPQKACRNDNRLVKTLILAALIPLPMPSITRTPASPASRSSNPASLTTSSRTSRPNRRWTG